MFILNFIKKEKEHRIPNIFEAILTFAVLVLVMVIGIKVFKASPHIPMMLGVMFASLMALRLGYT